MYRVLIAVIDSHIVLLYCYMAQIQYRTKEDQNMWNMLFSVLFLIIFVLSFYVLVRIRGSIPHTIPLFDVVLMVFATFRITRLVVYDKITRFFREWFVECEVVEKDGVPHFKLVTIENGIRGTIHDLLGCPWCIGIWSALIIAFAYFAFDWAWYVIFVLALAGAGSLLQLTANMIGWKAENLKLDATDKNSY